MRHPKGDRRTAARAWRRAAGPLLLAALTTAIYVNAVGGPFLLDDQAAVEENPSIRSLTALSVLQPPRETPVSGRPLANLTFAANFAAGGVNVRGYRLTNMALHVLTALTLFGVLRRTVARQPPSRLTAHADAFALLLTAAWAFHPLNTETVNYITQRTESLMALFFLLALYSAIRSLDDRRGRWTALTGLSALAAAASKETALVLPLIILLWDRAFAFTTIAEAWSRRRSTYAAAAAAWVFFALMAGTLPSQRGLTVQAETSRWMYLLNQAEIIPHYLLLAVWPRDLIFDYGPMRTIAVSSVLPGLALLAALLSLTGYAWRRAPAVGFWGAWFFITLAPASSLIPIATEVGAERRMYLPLIGLVSVIGLLGARVLASDRIGRSLRSALSWGVPCTILSALAVGTVIRNADYRSGVTIWETVVERRPHARAHEHLSIHLRDEGRIDEMIAHLRIAAAESPNSRHALAAALLEQGQVREAVAEFAVFVKTHPDAVDIALARREYAAALQRAGEPEAALAQLRLAVRDAPGDLRTHLALADAFRSAGDTASAIDAYRQAERIAPRHVPVLTNLGVLLADAGQTSEAIALLRRALDVDPRQAAVRMRLTQALLVSRDFESAEREARALVGLTPDSAEAHNLLGVALASQNQLAPAGREFEQAQKIDPANVDARQNLERIQSLLRQQGR